MRGRIIHPWDCPPGPGAAHRVVRVANLPPDCPWDVVAPLIAAPAEIELHHAFGRELLVQFASAARARQFVADAAGRLALRGYPLAIALSPIPQLLAPADAPARGAAPSRVICIQVMRLRVYLGIHDIFEECSHFGTVEKIICFEKTGKFALVQMATVPEAALALANLTNSPRHLPAFQMRIQYSKNQDIVIKFNNSKSFDFTTPDAHAQFAQLREMSVGESPFFEPEPIDSVPVIFDGWRPVHFDATLPNVLSVTGFEDIGLTECDHFRNLIGQYGPVTKVRLACHARKAAFVSMANGFSARIAVTFLQGWKFDGRPVVVELNLFHEGGGQSGADVVCDYQEDDSLEIEDYSAMWFPSECVSVKPPGIAAEIAPPEAVLHRGEPCVLQFASAEAAARFIAARNFVRVGRTVATLRFARLFETDA
jgi:hypothetical protein